MEIKFFHCFFSAKRFSLRTLLDSVRSRRQTAANGDSVIFVHPSDHDKSSPSAASPSLGTAGGRSSSPMDGSSNPELENLKPPESGAASAFGDLGAGMGGPGLGGAGERSLSPLGGSLPGLGGGPGWWRFIQIMFYAPTSPADGNAFPLRNKSFLK